MNGAKEWGMVTIRPIKNVITEYRMNLFSQVFLIVTVWLPAREISICPSIKWPTVLRLDKKNQAFK